MKIYKITEASDYLGVSINTLKTLANNGKIKSFKTTGEHRRFRQEDLDAYMGVKKEKQEKLTVIYARCSTAKQKENLDIEIKFWTNYEVCAEDSGYWMSHEYKVEKGIYAEYSGHIFHEMEELTEFIKEEADIDITEKELEVFVNTEMSKIHIKEVINVFLDV